MLRITVIPGGRTVVLKLEGALVGPWVAELEQTCAAVGDRGRPRTLDLAGLVFADRAGARLLATLAAQGVELTRGSLFLREQMRPPGGGPTRAAGFTPPDA